MMKSVINVKKKVKIFKLINFVNEYIDWNKL